MIIDAHGHLGRWEATHIPGGDAAGLVRSMDACGVAAICVSAFAAIGPAPREGNDLTMAAADAHPGRIYGYVGVNPNFPDEVRPELERCLAHPRMRAIKLHAGIHAYPVDGDAYLPAFEIAHERGLCVLIHGGGARELRGLARRYPRANLLWAHVGGWDGRTPSDMVEACRECPNLYADLASSVAYFGALEALVERCGAHKVVFGSDTPLLDVRFALGRVLFSALDEPAQARVLGGNAGRLLGLPGHASGPDDPGQRHPGGT